MRHSRRRTLALLAAAFLCLLPLRAKAQDALPCYAAADRPAEADDTLRCLGVAGDTVPLLPLRFPAAFRQTGDNRIADSCGVLQPVWGKLYRIHAGLTGDTLRIVHIGDSHVRGHIFPQKADSLLAQAFGAVNYTDMGVNGATCLTFTHPRRIEAVAALRPELVVLSFGTNEGHNRRYNAQAHYRQIDELVSLLRARMPGVPLLLTTPPGAYESIWQRRRRVYRVNARTAQAAATIVRYGTDHGLPVWDLFGTAGGSARACLNWTEAGLMRPDHIHFFAEGYTLQGYLFYHALIQAYNHYVVTR